MAVRRIPPDPFKSDAALSNSERESEWGWGAGMHPDPNTSYQHLDPRLPYNPPQPDDQVRELQAIRRMNTNDVAAQPDSYVAGNPDRYGPAKPLVRQRGAPCHKPPCPEPGPKFTRVE